MNKKGGVMLGLGIAVIIWFFGIFFLPYIIDDVTTFRTNFDCTNVTGITDGTKMSCLVTDAAVPYFLWALASLATGVLLGGMK